MNLSIFKKPTALYRPAPFWSWNDKMDKEELKRQIHEMSKQGWGSYFMHSRVGLVTEYLSDEWMDLVVTCAEEARKTDTYAWLYDEDKWPSGYASGVIARQDENFRGRSLNLVKKNELTIYDIIVSEVTSNDDFYICHRIHSLDNQWYNGSSYVDLMNPEVTQAFLLSTHEKYKKQCGQYFGKEIPGVFTDEPSYLRPEGNDVPWSTCLPDVFLKEKGYNIISHVESLFYEIGDYQKIRFDFYDCATRLFINSFTRPYSRWCEENSLIFTGHYMAEDDVIGQTKFIGAAMPHYEHMHWPGVDKLSRNQKQLVTLKQLTSVTDQLNKERALCEIFGTTGQQVSFYHRKWIADWAAILGINFVNHHLSLYSIRGERKRDYPPNFFYQQPWWDQEKLFSDYIGRLSIAAQQGKRDVDILIIHPIGSAWTEFSPLHKEHEYSYEKEMFDHPFERLSKSLMERKLDFHYGDEIIMENHGSVVDGQLIIGTHAYSTVIVPGNTTLNKTTLQLLSEFVQQNDHNRLIFMNRLPNRINGLKDDFSNWHSNFNPKTHDECLFVLEEYYSRRIKVSNRHSNTNATSIYLHTRETDDTRMILFANTDDTCEIHAKIEMPTKNKIFVMNLMDGELYNLPTVLKENHTEINLTFYPSGSLLLIELTDPDSNFIQPTIDADITMDCGVKFNTTITLDSVIQPWHVKPLEHNVLPINDVTLYMDNIKCADNEPLMKIWHDYFYKATDGTPFKAIYTFEVISLAQTPMYMAIENAENLDKITINGNPVNAVKERGELGAYDPIKSWKDICLSIVPLDNHVKMGTNTIIIEGSKINNITGPNCHSVVEKSSLHQATEVEAVYIVGDFQVQSWNNQKFYIDGKKQNITTPTDLTLSGYPFYSGKVSFKAEYNHQVNTNNKPIYLDLNHVNCAAVEIYINGHQVALKYWSPYLCAISDYLSEGINVLEIIASTTLFNLLGPNRYSGIENETFVSPLSIVDTIKYTDTYTLLPFGIGNGNILR